MPKRPYKYNLSIFFPKGHETYQGNMTSLPFFAIMHPLFLTLSRYLHIKIRIIKTTIKIQKPKENLHKKKTKTLIS